jgi:glycosyltransferase involved in cell wall biosynthesis
MNGDRRLLMFAYYFPPCTCFPTASARAAGLAGGLTEHAWEPVVITRANGCPCLDEDQSRTTLSGTGSPPLRVERVRVRPSLLSRVWMETDSLYRNGFARPLTFRMRRRLRSVRWSSERSDDWQRAARRRGERVLETEGADAVWTTSGPYLSVGIGRSLQRRYHVTWVADLRDSIARDRPWEIEWTGSVSRYVRRVVTRRWFPALRKASAVVGVSPQEAAIDAAALGREVRSIPSGFDPSGWRTLRSGLRETPRSDRFQVVYTGACYGGQIPSLGVFFEGCRLLVGASPTEPGLSITYLGPHGRTFLRVAEAAGCGDLVVDRGTVPPEEARRLMTGADLLLLLVPWTREGGIPGGKLYEFLASGSPILAVQGRDPYVHEVLADAGVADEASTAEAVAEILRRRLDAWGAGRAERRAVDGLDAYHWTSRARELAALLSLDDRRSLTEVPRR